MNVARALLEVTGLTLRVGRRTLVNGLSMQVRAGEVWCILGANGVGKTTLFNAFVGLRSADSGSIRIGGKLAQHLSALEVARERAFLPQSIRDVFSARVIDVVLLGRHPHMSRWAWEGEADHRLALGALHAVGLAEMAERDITTLSGGERQRAAIAALIVQETPLVLLDEPVAHLDLHHQTLILRHLRSLALKRGRAVVFSVHDLNLAARFATHAILFHDGGAVDVGSIDEVMSDSALSGAFHCPVQQMKVGNRTVFLAN